MILPASTDTITKFTSELGDLANPNFFQSPINVNQADATTLLDMLKTMLIIRSVETHIAELVESGHVKCPCHLGIGQEAIAVGVASKLRTTDRLFGTHRSHSQFLALGGSVYELFAEVLGKVTGCAKGVGGSMHLLDQKIGFYGSVPIVGGTIPLAVGAALAAKMDKKGDIAICFFGDGAAEEGVLHESLNLASIHRLPILFVCENNLYSSHLDIKLRQPTDRISRFADAHHIPATVVDGNDVLAVSKATETLVNDLRAGKNAGFLEAVTYRWRGHVGPKEDVDVGVRRKQSDLINWKQRDPITRLINGMIANQILTSAHANALVQEVEVFVIAQKDKALKDPYPDPAILSDHVYKQVNSL